MRTCGMQAVGGWQPYGRRYEYSSSYKYPAAGNTNDGLWANDIEEFEKARNF